MKILVVSNMYPDKKHPSAGIFVKKFCDELELVGLDYKRSVMYKYDTKLGKLWGYFSFYVFTFLRTLFSRYDLVYIHYASHSSIPVLLARRFKKIRIYTNVHGSDVVPENEVQKKFQKYTSKILSLSDKVIVPSEYFKEYVAKKYSIDRKNISIYPSSGVDRNMFRALDENALNGIRKKHSINPSLKTFCYVGRITANKGWDTYLCAIRKLVDEGKMANFIFVGDGLERDAYNKLIEDLSLSQIVKKYPLLSQKELVEIYNISDAFIFPTQREGESLGLVAIEAMACGTPVIASDFAAPKYYVHNSVNGYKFIPGDASDLKSYMSMFIEGEALKRDMFEGCQKTAEEYGNNKIRDDLREVFEV